MTFRTTARTMDRRSASVRSRLDGIGEDDYPYSTKGPPAGGYVYSWGGGPAFSDAFYYRRGPSANQLVESFKSIVYSCCWYNANAVASVPLRLYVTTKGGQNRPQEGSRAKFAPVANRVRKSRLKSLSYATKAVSGAEDVDEVTDHPLLDVVQWVSPDMDHNQLIQYTSICLDLLGTAFWWPLMGRIQGVKVPLPQEIWPLLPQYVYPIMGSGNMVPDAYQFGSEIFPKDDLVVFKKVGTKNPYALGMGSTQAAIEYARLEDVFVSLQDNVLSNGPRPNVIISPKDGKASFGQAERQRLEADMERRGRMGRAGGVFVIDGALDVNTVSYQPTDTGGLQLSDYNLERTCNDFGIPPTLFSKETNLANAQAAYQHHAKFTVEPRCKGIASTLTRWTHALDTNGALGYEQLFWAFDPAVAEDKKAEADLQKTYVDMGVITRNEVRLELGYDPDPDGDVILVAGTLKPLKDVVHPPEPQAAGAGMGAGVGGGGNAAQGMGGGEDEGDQPEGDPGGSSSDVSTELAEDAEESEQEAEGEEADDEEVSDEESGDSPSSSDQEAVDEEQETLDEEAEGEDVDEEEDDAEEDEEEEEADSEPDSDPEEDYWGPADDEADDGEAEDGEDDEDDSESDSDSDSDPDSPPRRKPRSSKSVYDLEGHSSPSTLIANLAAAIADAEQHLLVTKNCGTGSGGFKPGNTCNKKRGGVTRRTGRAQHRRARKANPGAHDKRHQEQRDRLARKIRAERAEMRARHGKNQSSAKPHEKPGLDKAHQSEASSKRKNHAKRSTDLARRQATELSQPPKAKPENKPKSEKPSKSPTPPKAEKPKKEPKPKEPKPEKAPAKKPEKSPTKKPAPTPIPKDEKPAKPKADPKKPAPEKKPKATPKDKDKPKPESEKVQPDKKPAEKPTESPVSTSVTEPTVAPKPTASSTSNPSSGSDPWSPKPVSEFKEFSKSTDMDDWGKKAYEGWGTSLKKSQEHALEEYSNEGYIWMNKAIRSGDVSSLSPTRQKKIAALSSALAKAEVPDSVTVFRGVTDPRRMGIDLSTIKEGDVIHEAAFVSTSLDRARAEKFAMAGGMIMRIHVPKGSRGGAYVNATPDPMFPQEKEFLMGAGVGRYRVVGVKPGKTPEITVELVH